MDNVRGLKSIANFKQDFPFGKTTREEGQRYLRWLEKRLVVADDIRRFVDLNDAVGNPRKESMLLYNNIITCSPTSIYYIYRAITILDDLASKKEIIEYDCGYGGLYLAINFFAHILNISIQKYYMINTENVNDLISIYIHIVFKLHIPFVLQSTIDVSPHQYVISKHL